MFVPELSSYAPVGELIGGSQREERIDVMESRMGDVGLDPAEYEWYMDLRRGGLSRQFTRQTYFFAAT